VYKGIIAQIQQGNTNPFNVHPNVQILDEPTIDPKPLVPSRRLIAYGGILAAIFGSMALILFLETRNPLLSPKGSKWSSPYWVEFPVSNAQHGTLWEPI